MNSEKEEQDMVWNCFVSLNFEETSFRVAGLTKSSIKEHFEVLLMLPS